MNTTLKRFEAPAGDAANWTSTCETISAVDKLRVNPSFPVRQNWQASAHPICDERHNVKRSSPGIATDSTVAPSASASSKRRVPSADSNSLTACGNEDRKSVV